MVFVAWREADQSVWCEIAAKPAGSAGEPGNCCRVRCGGPACTKRDLVGEVGFHDVPVCRINDLSTRQVFNTLAPVAGDQLRRLLMFNCRVSNNEDRSEYPGFRPITGY